VKKHEKGDVLYYTPVRMLKPSYKFKYVLDLWLLYPLFFFLAVGDWVRDNPSINMLMSNDGGRNTGQNSASSSTGNSFLKEIGLNTPLTVVSSLSGCTFV